MCDVLFNSKDKRDCLTAEYAEYAEEISCFVLHNHIMVSVCKLKNMPSSAPSAVRRFCPYR